MNITLEIHLHACMLETALSRVPVLPASGRHRQTPRAGLGALARRHRYDANFFEPVT